MWDQHSLWNQWKPLPLVSVKSTISNKPCISTPSLAPKPYNTKKSFFYFFYFQPWLVWTPRQEGGRLILLLWRLLLIVVMEGVIITWVMMGRWCISLLQGVCVCFVSLILTQYAYMFVSLFLCIIIFPHPQLHVVFPYLMTYFLSFLPLSMCNYPTGGTPCLVKGFKFLWILYLVWDENLFGLGFSSFYGDLVHEKKTDIHVWKWILGQFE